MSTKYQWSTGAAVGVNGAAVVFALSGTMGALLPQSVLQAPTVGPYTVQETLIALCVVAFAATSSLAVALAACMTAHAQRAHARGQEFQAVLRVAVGVAISFIAVSAISMHLAWELMQGAQMDLGAVPGWAVWAGAVVLAISKPATNFVIAGVERIDVLDAREADEHLDTLAARRQERELAARERRTKIGLVGAASVAGALAAGAMAAAPPADAAPIAPQTLPAESLSKTDAEALKRAAEIRAANPQLGWRRVARMLRSEGYKVGDHSTLFRVYKEHFASLERPPATQSHLA